MHRGNQEQRSRQLLIEFMVRVDELTIDCDSTPDFIFVMVAFETSALLKSVLKLSRKKEIN